MDRREFLGFIGMATLAPTLSRGQDRSNPFGLIVRLKAAPGMRDELIAALKDGAIDMPGCLSYVVANDASAKDVVWITEVWESASSHDASLSLTSVKSAMARAKGLISEFSRIAITSPVWEVEMASRRPFI